MGFSRSIQNLSLISLDTGLFPTFLFYFYKKNPFGLLNVFCKTCILPYSIMNFLNIFWNFCITFFWHISCCNWMWPIQQYHPDKWDLITSAHLELTRLLQYDLNKIDNIFFTAHLAATQRVTETGYVITSWTLGWRKSDWPRVMRIAKPLVVYDDKKQ